MLDSELSPVPAQPWYAKGVLRAAAVYNLLWGMSVIFFPTFAFELLDMELPRYPEIWQCVGMVVGVYGIGYWIAAEDSIRHWPIVLVGLLGKVLGPIGFAFAASAGTLPWSFGVINIFNDLIWWVPFVAILYQAAKANCDHSIGRPHDIDDAIQIFPSSSGHTLAELSAEKPLMLVFLRHFGCTFCRQALDDISKSRQEIENYGVDVALVHMSHDDEAEAMLRRYRLQGIEHFSDGNCEIYRAFGLDRGTPSQLLGLAVWWRGLRATISGHLVGRLAGDGFRMPGLFLIYQGEVYGAFRHRTAADRPNYVQMAHDCQQAIQREKTAR